MLSGRDLNAITAGHVINNGSGQVFSILNRRSNEDVTATHIPSRYPDRTSEIAQECGILKVTKEHEDRIDVVIPRLHIHQYTAAPGQKKHLSKVDTAFDLDPTGHRINRGIALWHRVTASRRKRQRHQSV
jgi:hypothetical protein